MGGGAVRSALEKVCLPYPCAQNCSDELDSWPDSDSPFGEPEGPRFSLRLKT